MVTIYSAESSIGDDALARLPSGDITQGRATIIMVIVVIVVT